MTISPDLFAAWRTPRFGTANPTRLDNPLWASLVHDRINAWAVGKKFGYARKRGDGPTWCFERFGQSTTLLGDRTIYIAGEHEDYYDPDFYIYNDVVIVEPDRSVAIYGYPRDVFPPTDFHTATLDGDRIWIVGCLGYPDDRKAGTTQVCRLDLTTMAIELLATRGESPGWIHKHVAELVAGTIVVRGGLVEQASGTLDENIDDWALELASLTWTRRTARDWQRWTMKRSDGGNCMLWELRQLQFHAQHPEIADSGYTRERVGKHIAGEPDLALLDTLYRYDGVPVVDDDFNVFRIELDGVAVRFTEKDSRIAVIVEGKLAPERLRALQEHVLEKLGALHFASWEIE